MNKKTLQKLNTKVLLFKSIPLSAQKKVILDYCERFGIVQDYLFLWDSEMGFVEFETRLQAQNCYNSSQDNVFKLKDKIIQTCFSQRDKIIHSKSDKAKGPSKVIIITYENYKKISKLQIRAVFSKFGAIRKIMIFKRKYKMSFIEYIELNSAIKAKETLNKANLKNLSFIRIKYSKRSQISQGNKKLKINECRHNRSLQNCYQKLNLTTKQFTSAQNSFFDYDAENSFMQNRSHIIKNLNQSQFSNQINLVKNTILANSQSQSYTDSQTSKQTTSKNFLSKLLARKSQEGRYVIKVTIKDGTKAYNLREIYNLFSKHGKINIIKNLFLKQNIYLVEFKHHKQASQCIDRAKDYQYCFQIEYSKYKHISLSNSQINQEFKKGNEDLLIGTSFLLSFPFDLLKNNLSTQIPQIKKNITYDTEASFNENHQSKEYSSFIQ